MIVITINIKMSKINNNTAEIKYNIKPTKPKINLATIKNNKNIIKFLNNLFIFITS